VNAPQARISRRYEFQDSLSWQKGAHRIKVGMDVNRIRSAGLWGFCTPYCEGVFGPEFITNTLGAATTKALFPNLPTTLTTAADFYNLPFLSLSSGIFTGIPVGNSNSTPYPYDYGTNLWQSQYRLYVQDTWKVRPNFTMTLGLAWNAQTGWFNNDLHYSSLLAPIIGANNLNNNPQNNLDEFSPAIGFAWSPGKSQKWVIRGGAGLYWDSVAGYQKLR
jgi:outer membrane receptor protein involved in Fe transport